MKTADLIGPALDWAVAKAKGLLDADIKVGKATCEAVEQDGRHGVVDMRYGFYFRPSTDWSQGGPIIESERITIKCWHFSQLWHAGMNEKLRYTDKGEFIDGSDFPASGLTPLIAAMRCYVASKLGDEIDVPKELL